MISVEVVVSDQDNLAPIGQNPSRGRKGSPSCIAGRAAEFKCGRSPQVAAVRGDTVILVVDNPITARRGRLRTVQRECDAARGGDGKLVDSFLALHRPCPHPEPHQILEFLALRPSRGSNLHACGKHGESNSHQDKP